MSKGVVGFIKDEKRFLKISDSPEPDMLGADVLDFIVNINHSGEWESMKFKVDKIENVPSSGWKKIKLNVTENDDLGNGVEWMEKLYFDEQYNFEFDNDFIKDSLHCDFGYIINLDTMCFEMYIGNQKELQKGNIFGSTNINGYYPCKLIIVIQLYEIIENKFETIVKHINSFNTNIENIILDDIIPKRQQFDLEFRFKYE